MGTPDELESLAIVEEAECLVANRGHDPVAMDPCMAILVHRGLRDVAHREAARAEHPMRPASSGHPTDDSPT